MRPDESPQATRRPEFDSPVGHSLERRTHALNTARAWPVQPGSPCTQDRAKAPIADHLADTLREH